MLQPKTWSAEHPTINPESGTEAKKIYHLASQAWPDRVQVAIAWVVASWFVSIIKDAVGFFPFLSFHGDTQVGKTYMIRALNAFQCIDEEGIPMRKTNTSKGELRKISQRSGLFTALLEAAGDPKQARFDWDAMLTMFNKNSSQIRGVKSNDNQTSELPFSGSVVFVQNREPFKTKPQKERVISLEFKAEDLTDFTREAFEELENIPISQKANFFVEIMKHRQVQ